MVLELVDERIEPPRIVAGAQHCRMGPDAIPPADAAGGSGAEPVAQGVVDDLLERLTEAMRLIGKHPCHVRVEGQRSPHRGIMMRTESHVKMR